VVDWRSGGNIALAVLAERPELISTLVVVEAPFHGLRFTFMNAAVLRTLVRLKYKQFKRQPVQALEGFLRFGSAYRTGGNAYDELDETRGRPSSPMPRRCWPNGTPTRSG